MYVLGTKIGKVHSNETKMKKVLHFSSILEAFQRCRKSERECGCWFSHFGDDVAMIVFVGSPFSLSLSLSLQSACASATTSSETLTLPPHTHTHTLFQRERSFFPIFWLVTPNAKFNIFFKNKKWSFEKKKRKFERYEYVSLFTRIQNPLNTSSF